MTTADPATNPDPIDEELAEERRREQSAMFDSSEPLRNRIEEFRKALRESQGGAGRTENARKPLLGKF